MMYCMLGWEESRRSCLIRAIGEARGEALPAFPDVEKRVRHVTCCYI